MIAPTVGMTAFPHDPTPLQTRRLGIDAEDTVFFHQFAFPGLATFPMLPATSVRIGTDPDGLPIGVQVIADLYADRTAIAAARTAHELSWSDR
ncbi:amidase family protein [Sphingomonas adhaesiva]|uniref:amidase family protein n=1 Tax=Sphingomonas adhaesiva TaxID=28212 RepID=UPI002FF5E3EB